MPSIMKAVIPAAGLGTRFLPATKAQPKEMLPILDKPTIQYVVEEAVASGIDELLIITGKGKRAIEEHFAQDMQLHPAQQQYLEDLDKLLDKVDIHYVIQKEQKGLSDAIYCAKDFVGDEPFAVLLGDVIVKATEPCTSQLQKVFEKHQSSVIAVESVPDDMVELYGIISGTKIEDNVYELHDIIEKPSFRDALSNLAAVGRYIFTPEIFEAIEKTKPSKSNELLLADSLRILMESQKVLAYEFDGKGYDIGNKIGWLKTNIDFAMDIPEYSRELKGFFRNLHLD